MSSMYSHAPGSFTDSGLLCLKLDLTDEALRLGPGAVKLLINPLNGKFKLPARLARLNALFLECESMFAVKARNTFRKLAEIRLAAIERRGQSLALHREIRRPRLQLRQIARHLLRTQRKENLTAPHLLAFADMNLLDDAALIVMDIPDRGCRNDFPPRDRNLFHRCNGRPDNQRKHGRRDGEIRAARQPETGLVTQFHRQVENAALRIRVQTHKLGYLSAYKLFVNDVVMPE